MNDKLDKRRNPLPALPTAFGNLAPLQLPPIDFERGLIPNYFQKRKLRQASEMQKHQADIAKYQADEVEANARRMMVALTFGADFRDKMDEFDYRKEMRTLGRYEKQEIVRGLVLKNEEQHKKNLILDMEYKDLSKTNHAKWKDMGYDPADEDRD